ncbi:hypothetical protein DSECCO2_301260 [anaerobic digester metagenome]
MNSRLGDYLFIFFYEPPAFNFQRWSYYESRYCFNDAYFSLSQPVIFSERSIKMIFADPLRSI